LTALTWSGLFAMRDIDVERRTLTEKAANILDVLATKSAISEAKISRLAPFGRGQDRAADAALPKRYASASDRYGGAAFVPRKAKHVRFLQRSAFF
jgi:hypothetical protein